MSYELQKLDLPKINTGLMLRFKFLSKTLKDPAFEEVYEGSTNYMSGEGLLMTSQQAPFLKWINQLINQEIMLGINIILPSEEQPLKALGKFAWLEINEDNPPKMAVGLKFKQLAPADKEKIFKFTIKSQFKA
ncbi:MAG: hypothetical protein HZA48_02495 [Planctomycetes bacterium]|nr:hypothetical protein [Planctomycetota bacterium]